MLVDREIEELLFTSALLDWICMSTYMSVVFKRYTSFLINNSRLENRGSFTHIQ